MKDTTKRNAQMVMFTLEELRELSTQTTVAAALAFLKIATDEGCTVGEVQKSIGLEPTSTSRAVSILMTKARGKEGLGLVETKPDDIDLRVKHLHLSHKGRRVWNRIERILER